MMKLLEALPLISPNSSNFDTKTHGSRHMHHQFMIAGADWPGTCTVGPDMSNNSITITTQLLLPV